MVVREGATRARRPGAAPIAPRYRSSAAGSQQLVAIGRLARFLGDEADARRLFDKALALDASAGPALLERTRRWAGEPPAHRGGLALVPATPPAATSVARTPDAVPADSEQPGAVVDPPARRVEHGCLRWEGELWELEFAGRAARVRDMKGLHDLAALLARPGAQTHVSALSYQPHRAARSAAGIRKE